MRKWIVWLLVFIAAGLVALFLLVPNTIVVKRQTQAGFPANAFSRAFFNPSTWKQWWPGTLPKDSFATLEFLYNGNAYAVKARKHSSIVIGIGNGKDSALTELILVPVKTDSVTINWLGATTTSVNPIRRLQKDRWMKGVQSDMDAILLKLQGFYAKKENLYAFPIRETAVTDSNLISISVNLPHYPATTDIYHLLSKLQVFAQKKGARQTGYPMLNITPMQEGFYVTRVALPLDKKVSGEGAIAYKRMLGGGNILVTEVRGGPYTIQQAFTEMNAWLQDHRRQSPAIPFQSLVTDRRNEPDSNKWVTKVYWPVM